MNHYERLSCQVIASLPTLAPAWRSQRPRWLQSLAVYWRWTLQKRYFKIQFIEQQQQLLFLMISLILICVLWLNRWFVFLLFLSSQMTKKLAGKAAAVHQRGQRARPGAHVHLKHTALPAHRHQALPTCSMQAPSSTCSTAHQPCPRKGWWARGRPEMSCFAVCHSMSQ